MEVKENSKPASQLDSVRKAGAGEELADREVSEATSWFLSEQEEIATRAVQLNVGVEEEHWVTFTVRAVDRDRIAHIRKITRQRGKSGIEGEVNEMEANLRIAAEGLADPDLTDPKVRGQYADPAQALRARFAHKPGLIDQLATRVIEVSGYDDADLREVDAVKA